MKKLVYALLIAGCVGSAYAAQAESTVVAPTEKNDSNSETIIDAKKVAEVVTIVEQKTLTASVAPKKQMRVVKMLKRIGLIVKNHPYITAGALTTIVVAGYSFHRWAKNAETTVVNGATKVGDALNYKKYDRTISKYAVLSAELTVALALIYYLSSDVSVEETAELAEQLGTQLPDGAVAA